MANTALLNDGTKFGVVCHDAGGANQIAAMLQTWKMEPQWVLAEGPARLIWHTAFQRFNQVFDFTKIPYVDYVITGTGWSSDLEHNARLAARNNGVKSVAVIDHWVNYEARFTRNGGQILPDEIWVVDEYAERLIKQIFPQIPILRKHDCYSEIKLKQIKPVNNSTPNALLYLLEPIRDDWGRLELGEFQALRFFLEKLPSLNLPNLSEIKLRLHPSESFDKYDQFLNRKTLPPLSLQQGQLDEAISNSRWVAGCHTYAMTLALLSGRRVFCSLPPWAPRCPLPHEGIEPVN